MEVYWSTHIINLHNLHVLIYEPRYDQPKFCQDQDVRARRLVEINVIEQAKLSKLDMAKRWVDGDQYGGGSDLSHKNVCISWKMTSFMGESTMNEPVYWVNQL